MNYKPIILGVATLLSLGAGTAKTYEGITEKRQIDDLPSNLEGATQKFIREADNLAHLHKARKNLISGAFFYLTAVGYAGVLSNHSSKPKKE
ncbi:MAG: hypothetical protein AABX11_02110 [Nanoarchaeota archaeon]